MQNVESQSERLAYSCPHCHKVMEVSAHLADETVKCTRCGKPFHAVAPNAAPLDHESYGGQKQSSHSAKDVVDDVADAERTLYQLHPSMFRNHPLIFLGAVAMLVVGLLGMANYGMQNAGIDFGNWTITDWEVVQNQTLLWIGLGLTITSGLYLVGWRIRTLFETLKITTERSIYQRGLISRRMSEVRHDDVRNLLVNQSFVQRLLDVGLIAVSSSGQDDFEIRAKGMPHPARIAEIIRNYQ